MLIFPNFEYLFRPWFSKAEWDAPVSNDELQFALYMKAPYCNVSQATVSPRKLAW